MNRINEFVTMIRSYAARVKTTDAYELASQLSSASGLMRELYADKTPEGLSRYENVQELLNGIREFTESGRSITPDGDEVVPGTHPELRTLEQFMQDIALLTDADDDEKANEDSVSLMTIHAAKGLEFPAVLWSDSKKTCSIPDVARLPGRPGRGTPIVLCSGYTRREKADDLVCQFAVSLG